LGIWAPFLFFVALKRRDSLPKLLAALALLSLLVALGKYFFFHRLVCALVPGFSMIRVAFRFLYLYVLAGCALLAIGYQLLESSPENGRGKHVGLVAGIYTALLLLFALSRPEATVREIGGLLLGSVGLFLWFNAPSCNRTGRILFAAGVLLPLLLMSWNTYSLGPKRNLDFKSKSPAVLDRVLREIQPFRLFTNADIPYPLQVGGNVFSTSLPDNAALAFPYKTIRGYNPLRLNNVNDLNRLPFLTTMRLLAVRGILSKSDAGEIPGFTRTSLDSFFFFETQPPLLYAWTPSELRVIPDASQRLAVLKDESFQPYRTAVLSEALPPELPFDPAPRKSDPICRFSIDEPDHQLLEVRLELNSLLVVSEPAYPGWKAWVDGKPARLFTADHALRSLFVPAGEHRVEFRFEPFWAKALFPALGLWFLSSLLFLFLDAKRPIQAAPRS